MIHTDLPLYKSTYDFLLELTKSIKNFSVDYKHTLGKDLRYLTVNITKNIYQYNSTFDSKKRIGFLTLSQEKIEEIRLYLKLCKDLNLIGDKTFSRLVLMHAEISKQVFGCKRYEENKLKK